MTQFEAFLIVFFLMVSVIMLIAVAGIIDSYLDPDPEAITYDTDAQNTMTKGVQL